MRVLHWFRKDLRLHDNASLLASLNPPNRARNEQIELFFLYAYDMTTNDYDFTGYRQAQFLLESLIDLDNSLAKLANFRLLIIEGDPLVVCGIYMLRITSSSVLYKRSSFENNCHTWGLWRPAQSWVILSTQWTPQNSFNLIQTTEVYNSTYRC